MPRDQILLTQPITAEILEAERISARHGIPAMVLAGAQLHSYVEQASDTLFMELHAWIYGKKQQARPETVTKSMTKTVTLRRPASWWQAFKLAAIEDGNPFFDPAKVRWTTETRDVTLTAELKVQDVRLAVWPDMPTYMPEHWGQPIHVALPPRIDWRVVSYHEQ